MNINLLKMHANILSSTLVISHNKKSYLVGYELYGTEDYTLRRRLALWRQFKVENDSIGLSMRVRMGLRNYVGSEGRK